MPYTADATDVANPTDAGVKASTAAAEFRTIKIYIRDVLLAGLVLKAPLASPALTGVPTAPLGAAALNTSQLATAAFVQQELSRLTGMVVNVSGNVGIGTSTPQAKLAISAAGAEGYEIAPTGGYGGGVALTAINRVSVLYVQATSYAAAHTWWTNSQGRAMDLDAAGNLGIGFSTMSAKLQVAGSGWIRDKIALQRSTGPDWIEIAAFADTLGGAKTDNLSLGNNGGGDLLLHTNGAARVRLDANGNAKIFNTVSAPATPSGGGILYVQAGALKFIGSSGTVTTLAVA